jgi:hypothetical protein
MKRRQDELSAPAVWVKEERQSKMYEVSVEVDRRIIVSFLFPSFLSFSPHLHYQLPLHPLPS